MVSPHFHESCLKVQLFDKDTAEAEDRTKAEDLETDL